MRERREEASRVRVSERLMVAAPDAGWWWPVKKVRVAGAWELAPRRAYQSGAFSYNVRVSGIFAYI
jgi:hypothetical protein